MEKIHDVWFNEGRWLVRCPVCHSKTHIKPKQDEIKWYCGACYPGKLKTKPTVLPNAPTVIWGFDRDAQKRAADLANTNDEIYIAVMPNGWKTAEKLLMVRRTKHMGWYPGNFKPPNDKQETIEHLIWENTNDPLLDYIVHAIEEKTDTHDEKPKTVKQLSENEFRSLQ